MRSKPRARQKRISRPAISKRRLWLFRIVAVVLIPLALLAFLEVGLRIAHYGYPTSFFVPERIGDRDYFVSNDRFGFRFFPKTIARTPFPIRMAAIKPAKTFRIFLFGESAAQGDPDPTFGVGRYLEVLLRERFPEAKVEVICTAMTAINSHAILPIARECANHDGDLWIIYMGNNEMVGPFGGGTIFGPRAPNRLLVSANLAVKATRTGQWLGSLLTQARPGVSAQKSWDGLNMFQDNALAYDDPARLRAYRNFSANLADIISIAQDVNVPVLLSTVASNLKDCAPFASLHKTNLNPEQLTKWNQLYESGKAAESSGSIQEARELYRAAAVIDGDFAELQFRIARCDLSRSNFTDAKIEFERARDDDALAFRADSRVNKIIATEARRGEKHGVHLIDAADSLARQSPDGIAGQELFYEHVHLNFEGNYWLARLFADQVAALLPETFKNGVRADWASAQVCDKELAVSVRDRYRVWMSNFSRVSGPPFTAQINDVARAKFYMGRLEELKSLMSSEAEMKAGANYQRAVARQPDDPSLHGNAAQFFAETGDLATAVKEQERVCELLPGSAAAHHKKGVLLARECEMDLAAKEFSSALKLRPDYVPALNELGLIYFNRQEAAAAAKCFNDAIQLNPGFADSFLNLGFTEQANGNFGAAKAHYQEAANLQREGPAAHFSRAVQLAANHQRTEAIKFFEAAVWMNPGFWQARYLLGVELAAQENLAAAEAQFAEVIRLRPDFAKAHLNLGVALAKARKLDKAAAEFRTVLQLNGTNELAQRHLETIELLKKRIGQGARE